MVRRARGGVYIYVSRRDDGGLLARHNGAGVQVRRRVVGYGVP